MAPDWVRFRRLTEKSFGCILLYPLPSAIDEFKDELAVYEGGKGSVQFPLDQPVPFDLIRKIVKFRVQENLAKAEAKEKKKRGK